MSNDACLGSPCILLLALLMVGSGCNSALPWNRSAFKEKSVLDQQQRLDVQLALGRTFEKQQQWDAARTVYREILRRDPEQAAAAHRLAIVYDLHQDRENAARWFEQALQYDPDNADISCDRAYSRYRQGDLAGAESDFRRALALDPHHRRAQNQLGLVLARTNRREEALAQFQKAGCTPSEAHSNLAFALGIQHRTEQATAEWQIASGSAPDLPEHRRRLDAVASLIARVAATDQRNDAVRSASAQTTTVDSPLLR